MPPSQLPPAPLGGKSITLVACSRFFKRKTPVLSAQVQPMRTGVPLFFHEHQLKGSLGFDGLPSMKLRWRYQSSTKLPGGARPSTELRSLLLTVACFFNETATTE